MAANLTPQQIAAILGGTAGQGWAYNPAGQNAGGSDTFASMGPQSYDQSFVYRDPQTGLFDTYGKDGQYLDTRGDSYKMTAADFLKFAAAVAGAGALSGAAGGAATTLGGAAPSAGLTAGGVESVALPSASTMAGSLPEITVGAGTGGTAAGGGLLGTTGLNAMRAGELAGYATNGSLPSSAAVANGLGTGSYLDSLTNGVKAVNSALGGNLGGLVGAAAGALGSQDQTKTTGPWAPAQDFIKQQIAQGQDLSKQYQAQPFNAAQQTQYNNIGGLLNAMNTMAPTMMQGYANNASGANQFSLSNPRKSLLGSNVMQSGATWNPGLLNFFPQKG